MSTVYPGTKQTFSDPAGTSTLSSPDHASLHTDKNDTIEAIEDTVGTTLGTNVLKNFATGEFPVRATGGGATGTLKQTIVGGTYTTPIVNNATIGTPATTGGTSTAHTINNSTVGTPAITGGTSTSMKVVGTNILSSAGLIGTPGILGSENPIVGTYTNTTYNDGTNLGSISFTPGVNVVPIIFFSCAWRNSAASAVNSMSLKINGTQFGTANGLTTTWMDSTWAGTTAGLTSTTTNIHVGPVLAAGGTHTIIFPISTSVGSAVVFGNRFWIIPFPAV